MPASGGGSISVDPAALETMAGRISGVAAGTVSVRGSAAASGSAADGCPGPAASSFARMHSTLDGNVARLAECASALGRALSAGAAAYVITDTTQMPAAPAS
jgi:uncharacterized protein YukE